MADVFAYHQVLDGIVVAITNRLAPDPGPDPAPGSPAGPRPTDAFGGFNLAGHVGDDPARVAEHRTRLAAQLGAQAVVFMSQRHTSDVVVVEAPWAGEAPVCDALVSTTPGLALAVQVADCVPVLLADANAGVVAAVHAGRAGFVGGIVPAAVAAMRDLGAETITATVGPSICGRCYEVPEDLRDLAAAVEPVSAAVSWTGTAAIDVAGGVVAQLHRAEVAVRWLPGCTREREDLYSYRRDGRTGRFAGVVMVSPPSQDTPR